MKQLINRKVAIIGLIALAILVLVLSIVPGLAAEEPHVGIDEFDNDCILFDGNGAIVYIPAEEAKINGENGANDVILLQCEATVANDTGKSQEWDAYYNPLGIDRLSCQVRGVDDNGSLFGGNTLQWKINVSASGNALLTCHFGDQTIK